MAVVVDASLLAKLFVLQEGRERVRAWFADTVGTERLLAPHLLRYELGRVLQRERGDDDPALLARVLENLLANVQLDQADAATTFEVAGAGLTYYDASYVALAKAAGARLASHDRRMCEVASRLDVPVLDL